MKFAPLSLPLLLLTGSCASFGGGAHRATLLSTERATVQADLASSKHSWSIGRIMATSTDPSDARLLNLTIVAFADHDGDNEVDADERRGGWNADSSVGSRQLGVSGNLALSSLPPGDLECLKVQTRVRYVADPARDDEEVSVVPFRE